MKCSKCGKKITNDSNFCEYCGNPVKKSHKKIMRIVLAVALILILTIIMALCGTLFGSKVSQFADTVAEAHVENTPTELKNIVQDLCDATLNHDYFRLEQLYSSNVSRYHDRQNLSNGEVVEMHRKYDKQFGVHNKSISVRWDTFQASWRNYDGHTTITYIIDYHIDREDKSKYSNFVIKKYLELNCDYKIVSEYDEQLSKSK